MAAFVTHAVCGARRWKLFAVAMIFVLPCATAIGVATKFSLDARSEAREVRASCDTHLAVDKERWIWTKAMLTEIKQSLKSLQGGHAHTESAATDGEG